MNRNRKIYFMLVVATILIGLASRKYPFLFGDFFAVYLGDTLWALLVFWMFAWLFKTKNTFSVVLYESTPKSQKF